MANSFERNANADKSAYDRHETERKMKPSSSSSSSSSGFVDKSGVHAANKAYVNASKK